MPKSVPKRAENHYDYAKDCPLTALGNFQAFLTGKFHFLLFSFLCLKYFVKFTLDGLYISRDCCNPSSIPSVRMYNSHVVNKSDM